jgi:hypothetical protein
MILTIQFSADRKLSRNARLGLANAKHFRRQRITMTVNPPGAVRGIFDDSHYSHRLPEMLAWDWQIPSISGDKG